MPRYKLTVEYDGGPFRGWQRQADGPSVQEALEDAAARLAGGTRPPVRAAGRTDAGVHALGQVVHLDLARDIEPGRLRDALNAGLRPLPVTVLDAALAPASFDARRSAIRRRYLYRLLPRRSPPALDAGRVWHLPRLLDAAAMHAAAQTLLGRHDFTTFRAAECQASGPVRTLDRLDVARVGEEVHVAAAARSFLHHQVRAMVGTLVEAGIGRWSAGEVRAALDARDRARCGQMAPARGLYLVGVDYPEGAEACDATPAA